MRPRVRPEAESEALHGSIWYEDRRLGLGDRFYDEVLMTIEAIGRSPLRFPLYEAFRSEIPLRRAPVKGFPYYVIYVINEDDVEPLVVAVSHAKQRPGYWADRT